MTKKSRSEINKWQWCSCYIKKKQKKALQEMREKNKEVITNIIRRMEAKNEI